MTTKGEGRVLKITTWSLGLSCILRQIRKKFVNSQFELLYLHFIKNLQIFMKFLRMVVGGPGLTTWFLEGQMTMFDHVVYGWPLFIIFDAVALTSQ